MSWIQERLDEERRESERKRELAQAIFEKARGIFRAWSPAIQPLLSDVGTQLWSRRTLLGRRAYKIEERFPPMGYPSWRLEKRGGDARYDVQLVCRAMPDAEWESWTEENLRTRVESATPEDFFFQLEWGRDRLMAPLDSEQLKELLWAAYNRGPTHQEA